VLQSFVWPIFVRFLGKEVCVSSILSPLPYNICIQECSLVQTELAANIAGIHSFKLYIELMVAWIC
jgi:hypothetical protein